MSHKDPVAKRLYMREYSKRTYQRDKEKRYKNTLKWRKKNWDKHLAAAKRYREAHPDRVKETMRRVDQEPHRKQAQIDYKERLQSVNSPELRHWEKTGRLRRALKVSQNGGTCSIQQWEDRCRLYGFSCAYCGAGLNGKKVEIDHVIPVSSGGTGWPSNLVPACRSCNARKHAARWKPQLPQTRMR